MKKSSVLLIVLCFSFFVNAQQKEKQQFSENVLRLNFINPAIEYEYAVGSYSTFSAGIGVGYGGSYPDLDESVGTGWVYIISPFIDIQHKWFYNFEKRQLKGKNIKNNSANFLSIRFLSRGPSIAENIKRTSDFDFAIGPTWGIQRSFGKFHLLFDIGPIYYFDEKGNGNIFPVYPQLNLGFNL